MDKVGWLAFFLTLSLAINLAIFFDYMTNPWEE